MQVAGITCCLLRTVMYVYTVSDYYETKHAPKRNRLVWYVLDRAVAVIAFYTAVDLAPLGVLLWIVRVNRTQNERLSSKASSIHLSDSDSPDTLHSALVISGQKSIR